MTPAQIRTIQVARKKLGLEDPDYRTILRSIGHVESSKDLDHKGFERVMAFFEGRGFHDHAKGADYWRAKAGRQSDGMITDRQIRMIEAMAAGTPYEVPGLCWRHTHHRTRNVGELSEVEGREVIEMLKDVIDRQERAARQGSLFGSTPAAEGSAAGAVTEGPARTRATGTDAEGNGARRNASHTAKPPARVERPAAQVSPPDDVGDSTDDDIPF